MKYPPLLYLLLFLVLSAFAFAPPKKDDFTAAFSRINHETLKNSRAFEMLQHATSTIGHRLTGTENGKRAEELAFTLLKSFGIADVAYQQFEAESWLRGSVSLKIKGPDVEIIPEVVSLAHSPVKADVTAEMVDLGSGLKQDFEEIGDKLKGKIALINIGLDEGDSGMTNLHRSEKSSLAIERGATGIIIYNKEKGHILLTGTASVTGELIPVPAVCITWEQGVALKSRLAEKQKLVATLKMTNKSEKITARNVVATIAGTDLAHEKIIVGGHLDSWDLASGAIDNGIGSFSIIDMARTFRKLRFKPRRTVQFVLFMGEEEGLLGSKAMIEKMTENGTLEQVKYMINLDMAGNPKGFNVSGRNEMLALIDSIGGIMKKVEPAYPNTNISKAGLHSDHQPFMLEGIPVMQPGSNMNAAVYSCYHSSCDDFHLVEKKDMVNNVRYTSMILYALANIEHIPAGKLNSTETREHLTRAGLKEPLILGKQWKWKD